MILETLASALIGLLGTSLTTYSNYKMEKLKADNERKKMELENKLMISEAEANIRLAETVAEGRVDEIEAQAFAQSQVAGQRKALPENWVSILLDRTGWERFFTIPVGIILLFFLGTGDAIQHLMRSFLTLYSLGIATWVTWKSYDIMVACGVPFPNAGEAWTTACETAYLLAVMMVTWWFGDRRVVKNLSHMKKGQ